MDIRPPARGLFPFGQNGRFTGFGGPWRLAGGPFPKYLWPPLSPFADFHSLG